MSKTFPWVVMVLVAGLGWQGWTMHVQRTDLIETHQQLTEKMNEGYALQAELKEMTLAAHPFIKTGQVGPTASPELQCMQLLHMLPKPPASGELPANAGPPDPK